MGPPRDAPRPGPNGALRRGVLPDDGARGLGEVPGAADNDAPDSLGDGLQRILDFGQHSLADDPLGAQCREVVGRDFGDDRLLVVGVAQHAALLEAEDQIGGHLRRERRGQGRSHPVGIAVEQRAAAVVHDGREDGGQPRVEQPHEQPGIDPLDVAHEAVVDRFGGPAACRHDVAVGARQPQCVAPLGLQSGDELLVDQPGVDHRHHVERSPVGDAAAVDHLRLQLEPFGKPRGELPAAVDKYLGPFERGEFAEEALQRRGVVDDVAPDFHYRDAPHCPSPSSSLLSTTCAEISRLAASGMTSERGDSMTSSVTIMLRRTGRQCMK